MLYRMLDDIGPLADGTVFPKGSLQSLSELTSKTRVILLKKGFISEWQSPPLRVLPGWRRRAKALARAGIDNVNQLLSADLAALAAELDIPLETLERCAEEARQLTTL